MEIEVTIKAVLTLPDGTKLPENGRKFTLPDGSWVKPWLILESNDSHDLSLTEMDTVGTGITERFIKTSVGIVIIGDPQQVAGKPSCVKTPGPYTRETLAGKPADFVVGNRLPFRNRYWIHGLVVRSGSGRYVKQGHRFVQIER